MKACGEIISSLSEIWDEETKTAAGHMDAEKTKAGIQRIENNILQKRLAGPLGEAP